MNISIVLVFCLLDIFFFHCLINAIRNTNQHRCVAFNQAAINAHQYLGSNHNEIEYFVWIFSPDSCTKACQLYAVNNMKSNRFIAESNALVSQK